MDDDQDRKISMLIGAFDDERRNLQRAINALDQGRAQLAQDVSDAAAAAVADALKVLDPEIQKTTQALADMQRLSLWRTARQHGLVAAAAIAVVLFGVGWYVPTPSQIAARRAELDQMRTAIQDLDQRGARLKLNTCGPEHRLCVLVHPADGASANQKIYMIADGY
jgi:hypothetical protein